MLKYIIKRVLIIIPIFFIMTFVIYLLLSVMPGSNAAEQEIISLQLAGRENIDEAAIYAKYGLDVNVFMQYINWLGDVFSGTWGYTYASSMSQTVISVIGQRIVPTLILMGSGLLLAIVIGVPLGVLSALHPNGVIDNICTVLTFLGHSLPGFLLCIFGISLFSVTLGILPSQYSTSGKYPYIMYLLMPALIIAFTSMGSFIKQTRGSMLEVMNEEYVKTARAKGLPYGKVVTRHMLRNASIPIVTVIGLNVPTLVGGSVIIERIFSWPGLGNYLVTAISERDIPVIMGIVSIIILVVLLTNVLMDIIYTFLDPRIRV